MVGFPKEGHIFARYKFCVFHDQTPTRVPENILSGVHVSSHWTDKWNGKLNGLECRRIFRGLTCFLLCKFVVKNVPVQISRDTVHVCYKRGEREERIEHRRGEGEERWKREERREEEGERDKEERRGRGGEVLTIKVCSPGRNPVV